MVHSRIGLTNWDDAWNLPKDTNDEWTMKNGDSLLATFFTEWFATYVKTYPILCNDPKNIRRFASRYLNEWTHHKGNFSWEFARKLEEVLDLYNEKIVYTNYHHLHNQDNVNAIIELAIQETKGLSDYKKAMMARGLNSFFNDK